MAYSYDQHRPVWIDSARMDLDDQRDALRAMAETVPATLDDQPQERPWLGSVAAASQAPRIPRNRPIVGTSQQGRVVHHAGDIPQPTEPVMSELDWVRFDHRVLYPVCVLALLASAAAVFDVRWTDAVKLLSAVGDAITWGAR